MKRIEISVFHFILHLSKVVCLFASLSEMKGSFIFFPNSIFFYSWAKSPLNKAKFWSRKESQSIYWNNYIFGINFKIKNDYLGGFSAKSETYNDEFGKKNKYIYIWLYLCFHTSICTYIHKSIINISLYLHIRITIWEYNYIYILG